MQESINNQSMLKVGTILRGIYRIDSYLSSGGFGNTYVATNIEFDERVAIKEFFMKGVTQRDDNQTTVSVSNSENTNSFLEQKEKFKKEARRIRQLKNEHIVSVYDLFEENGTAYYVMDYVDGENLSDRLKRKGRPMTEFEVNLILPQVLDALKAIHDADIWHLDLKPANIMVDKRGRVKLIDFGASKQLNVQKGGATTSTAISYTNGYAPREQMEQNYDKFGPWTDIYALGATLYNLLTNKRPPLPTDIDDDMSEDKHVALPFPENVGGLKFLVHQMMKTNRLQRPQSIDAIINAEKTQAYDDEATIIAEPKPKKERKTETSEVKTEQNIYTQEIETESITTDNGNSTILKILCTIAVGLIAILLINNVGIGCNNTAVEVAAPVDSIADNPMVDRMQYETAIGGCQYSGPVDKLNLPNGIGEAFFNDGRYYQGGFEHGVLTGEDCLFRYTNGDEFRGKFRNSTFHYGTYTIASDGSYYVGSYKDGQPDGGTWYDKNGTVIENI